MTRNILSILAVAVCVRSACAAAPQAVTAIFAMDADGTHVREVASVAESPIINSPEVSPNGRYVAVDGWRADESLTDARLLIVDLHTGAVTDFGHGAMPSWSADGKWIAFCKYRPERGVYIRSLNNREERLIDDRGWGIQWAPDGLKAAYTHDGEFVIYDFIGDSKRRISFGEERRYSYIYWNSKWSPDSTQICFKARRANGDDEIGIVNVNDDNSGFRILCDGSEFNPDIAWSPDGTLITFPSRGTSGQPGQIFGINPHEYDAPIPLPGQPTDRSNSGMCWTRDGQTLYFLSRAISH